MVIYRKVSLTILLLLIISNTPSFKLQAAHTISLNQTDSVRFNVYYQFKRKLKNRDEVIYRTDSMVLSVGNRSSVYYDMNKQRRDSLDGAKLAYNPNYREISLIHDLEALQSRLERQVEIYDMLDGSVGESARIYKKRNERAVVTTDAHPSYTYILNEKEIIYDWIITEDTTTVLNFSCHKAITEFRGRRYAAWFTTDIPVDDGPWKLFGLPGLILKAEDEEEIFSFEVFGLMTVADQVIEISGNKDFIVCDDYKILQKVRKERFKKVTYGFAENGGMLFISAPNPLEIIEMER